MIDYSIVIPVYKTPELVVKCLDSIAAAARQTESSIEVIAVDDGSPDECPAILDAYQGFSTSANVTYVVHHKRNGGPGPARNVGMDIAHGWWLSFVDSDDLIVEDFFQSLDVAVHADSSADFISYSAESFENDSDIINFHSGDLHESDVEAHDLSRVISRRDYPNYCWTFAMSRRRYVNLRFKDYVMGEDLLFENQLVNESRKYVRVNRTIYGYRQRNGSICHTPESYRKIRDRIWAWRDILSVCESARNRVSYQHVRHYANHLTEFAVYAILSCLPEHLKSSERELWKIWRDALKEVVGFKCLSEFQRIRIRTYLLLHFKWVALVLFKFPFFMKLSLAKFR